MTAAALSRDKDLNPDGVNADKFESILNETRFYSHRAAVIPEISDVNKEKRLDFCR